jgi:hypothetical protein
MQPIGQRRDAERFADIEMPFASEFVGESFVEALVRRRKNGV